MNATSVARRAPPALQRGGPEPARYLAASAVALVIDIGSFSAAVRLLEMGWMSAAMLGFSLGVTATYLMSTLWVFRTRRLMHNPKLEFAAFIAIGIAGLCITQILLWLGIECLQWQTEFVRLLAAGATFAFNYFFRALTLFREHAAHT